jgi:hypothetical protein
LEEVKNNAELPEEQLAFAFQQFPGYVPTLLSGPITPMNLTFSSIMVPKDRLGQIRKARQYREIDLIDRLLRIPVDFGTNIKGFKFNSKNPRQQELYEETVLPLLENIIAEWFYDTNSLGDVFLHFGFNPNDNKTPMFLQLEKQEDVEIEEALGIEQYKVRVSSDFREQVKKLRDNKQIKQLPDYLQRYLNQTNKDTLLLTQSNMYRTSNLKNSYTKYTTPPLMKIAKAIELRESLLEVDYTLAFEAKQAILHARVGDERAKNGGVDGKRVENVLNLLVSQQGTYKLVTPADVKMEWVTPDGKLWTQDKYKEAYSRIMDWAGISIIVVNGGDSSTGNNTAIVSLKGIQQSIARQQKIFKKFCEHYFNVINKKNGWLGNKYKVELEFGRNNLRDSKELQAEVEFLLNSGLYGWKDACLVYDLDPDVQLEKRKFDWDHRDTISPHFEKSQALIPALDAKIEQELKLKAKVNEVASEEQIVKKDIKKVAKTPNMNNNG